MALKTYCSRYLSHSASYLNEKGKKETIHFVGGLFSTDSEHKQKAIEALHSFGREITIAPHPSIAAVANAVSLRSIADAAVEAAKAAEEAAEAHNPKKA